MAVVTYCPCEHVRFGVHISHRVLHRTAGSAGAFILQKENAIALQRQIWDQHSKEVDRLIFEDPEAGKVYQTTGRVFDAFKFLVDYGRGEQWALELAHWQTTRTGARQPRLL